MALKLVHVWNIAAGNAIAVFIPAARRVPPDDELEPSSELVARRQADEADAAWRREDERRAGEKKDRDQDDFILLSVWWTSDQWRQARQELFNDISDIQHAVRLAYGRALVREARAQGALAELQSNAIVASDGARVYFTRDGKELYNEDGLEITDAAVIEEADRGRVRKPDAPSYEMYLEKRQALIDTAEQAQHLAETLERLDGLKEKLEAQEITAGELAQARAETQEIIRSLPPEARQDYERIKEARQTGGGIAYRAGVDPALEHSRGVDAAGALPGSEEKEPDPTARRPAYRPAPEF